MARQSKAQTLFDSLIARGFDASRAIERDEYGRFTAAVRVRCSQCEALCINGVACHETGCPNIVRDTEDWDDEN